MLIFLIVFFSCLYAQQDIAVVKKEIYTLQYERQNISELHELLDHKNASIRLLVVQALGRIQNKDSISFLAKLLKDADVEIRIHVAFALGQMWHIDAESFLLKAMVTEKKIPVLEKIIEALGKVGETQTVAIFKKWMPEKKLCEFITKASGILVYRGVHNDQLIHQLIYFSQNESVSIRGHVSYALMRSKDSRVVNHLIQLLYDKNAFVRMNATRGLGYLKENKAVAHLYLRLYDEDARVATNAISALSNFKEVDVKKIIPLLTNKITNKNSHIFLATVKLLGTLKATESKQELIKAMKKSSFLEQGEICIALAKIDPKTCLEEIEKLEKTNTNALLTSKIAEALGNIDTKTSFEKLSKMLNNKNILVIQMVVSSLGKLTKEDTTPLLIESLKTLDMAVITYAAQSLATKKAIKSIPALVEIYSKLHLPQDIEAMQAIINAVGEMAQKSNETAINFLQKVNSNDEALLSAIASKYLKKLDIKSNKITQKKEPKALLFSYEEMQTLKAFNVEVHTNKGLFIIKALTKEAPVASMNFLKLIQKKFYDNLTFHRVISNFVVQGGDPRGDGWGGPGHTIPCEYNMIPYKRGMVGMPLAGKDTGGCQLFITHSPQPHLNGKYTIFGQVISGMDVVDLLQQGDVINKMVIKTLK